MAILAGPTCEDQYPPSSHNKSPEHGLGPEPSSVCPLQKWKEKVLGRAAVRILYVGWQRLCLQ